MRRLIIVSLIFIMVLSGTAVLALDTSDAIYTGVIRITNNGTAATNVSVPFTANTTVYINAGYMNSSANNTAITSSSGANVPYMPGFNGTSPWSIFVPSIGANNIQNDTLFMGGTTDMEGNLRYFPGSGGMTVVDSAGFEPGDNFSIEMAGFINTDNGTDKNLVDKPNAFRLFVSDTVSGNITSDLYSFTANFTQLSGNSDASIRSGAATRQGQRINLFAPTTITSVSFWLKKVTNPTGTLSATVRKVTDDSLIGTLGTLDVATLGAGYAEKTFTNAVSVNETEDIRILAEYSGGDGANFVRIEFQNTDVTTLGHFTGYTGTYLPSPTFDLKFKLSPALVIASSVSATGVTSGERTINVWADTVNWHISVDEVESDNTTVVAVPDNSANWTFFQNSVMPYVETANVTIDGTLQGSWEWEYSDTFTDASGNSHDATPSFRTSSSDADVSAELITFSPITEARAPAFTANISTTGWITADISQTGNFTTTTNSTYPGSEIISAVTTAGGVPIQLLELILAGVFVLSLSLFISWMMRSSREGSIFFKILVISAGLGIMIAVSIVDSWILYLFLMISIAIAMGASQRTFTGTGNSGNNMIGFLAMAFVGMTTINRILEGRFIQSADVDILRNTLAFQPFEVFGLFTIPVPNTDFLLNGIPALLRWDYSFFGGNAQIFQYMLYSITAVVSFMLFVLVFGAIYQMFSRGR